jgi:hypothetical protein
MARQAETDRLTVSLAANFGILKYRRKFNRVADSYVADSLRIDETPASVRKQESLPEPGRSSPFRLICAKRRRTC